MAQNKVNVWEDPDLDKWDDIFKEFRTGADSGRDMAIKFSLYASVGAVAFGGGLGLAKIISGDPSINCIGPLSVFAGAFTAANICPFRYYGGKLPRKDRPIAKMMGLIIGLGGPMCGGAASTSFMHEILTEYKAATSVKCNCDAVKDEINRLEDIGFKITLECK